MSAPDNTPASDASLTKGESQLLIAQGYDHNWVLNAQTPQTTGPDGLNLAARAFDPGSGRALAVWTDQPGVQFYSGNFLTGTLVGISGNTYRQGAGLHVRDPALPERAQQPVVRVHERLARARPSTRRRSSRSRPDSSVNPTQTGARRPCGRPPGTAMWS